MLKEAGFLPPDESADLLLGLFRDRKKIQEQFRAGGSHVEIAQAESRRTGDGQIGQEDVIGFQSLERMDRAAPDTCAVPPLLKRPDQFGKAMLFPAMVETYAILALLISILAVNGIPV